MDYLEYAKAAGEIAATLTREYGPTAWDTVLWVTRVNCLSVLATSFIVLITMVGINYGFWKFTNNFSERSDGVSYMLLGLPGLLWLFTSPIYIKVFSLWVWVGVFKPDLYLAKQLIDKVIN